MTISRSQMPRQMYGLGSLVKSIGKTVKKIVKSPVAKVAMLGFGANALMPGGLGSLFSGGSGLTGILGKGKSILDGLTGAQKITGALALGGAFAGMEDQQVEELKRNPEALRGYLAQYYRNLNKNATDQEVNEFVESNMTEYKADGGRIGYREGALAMGPGSGFTLKPPGELAYDATNTDIYGSSAASFTPKSIMNQSGNQVQAGFGKTPGPNQPLLAANPNNLIRSIEERKQMAEDMNNAPTGLMREDGTRANVTYENISDGRNTMPSMPGNKMFFSRAMPATPVPFAAPAGITNLNQLPIREVQPISEERMDALNRSVVGNGFYDLNKNELQSLFQEQAMPFAQQANSSSPMAQIAGMADGGRMGYDDGTPDPTYTGNNMEDLPRGLQIDTTTSNPIPEDADRQAADEIARTMMAVRSLPREEGEIEDTETMSTEDFMTREYLMPKVNELVENYGISRLEALKMVRDEMAKFVRPAKAYGGRMGFAMGNPEENAVQASGIMDLPLNQNPAGITELDLRETGGFIPPVGVKEKADDIPAMLSNNEFVFTADAVRGMGDGNVNKGAQRMYDMMKKLEKGGRV